MTTAAVDQLHGIENEVIALRTLTRRMTLTQKEMVCTQKTLLSISRRKTHFINSCFLFQEEVVLKRCWLARYWGLAVKYGILFYC